MHEGSRKKGVALEPEARKTAAIHGGKVAAKHEFSMLTALGSLKTPSKHQILRSEFLILSKANKKILSTCGRGAQKQSPVAWNCATVCSQVLNSYCFLLQPGMDIPGLQLSNQEYYPYVYFKIDLSLLDCS